MDTEPLACSYCDTVREFLREIEFEHCPAQVWTNHGTISFSIRSSVRLPKGFFEVRICGIEKSHIILYARHYRNVPMEWMNEASDLIQRLNFGRAIGCIELDQNDGEVRYRTSIDCAGSQPSYAILRSHFNRTIWGMNELSVYLEKVIQGELSAEEAEMLAKTPDETKGSGNENPEDESA